MSLNKRMKVIRITTSLDFGGIEKVFELHAKYHERDYELIFVSLGKGGRAEIFMRQLGYKVIILNTDYQIPSYACFKSLISLFKSEKPRVVHTCGAEANFHALLAAYICRIPVRIGEEIGIPSHSLLARVIFKAVYRTAHHVIAISHAVKLYLTANEVSESKVRMLYNPINLSIHARVQPGFFRNSCKIACVGRLEPIKNLTMLIDLLSLVIKKHADRSFELWLIGDGSQREYLMDYAISSGVGEYVKFKGFVAAPETLLVQADVFVLPSLFEGFGLACVEAIQCGLPVIVSKSGGMAEYIEDGKNGLLFDPRSLAELEEKMELFLSMPLEKLNLMTAVASKKIHTLFSPQKYVHELSGIYQAKIK
jgi:glycosyltransferase involved in cell wall biosynthesis